MQQGQRGGEPVGVGVILGWQEDKGSSATGRVVVDAVAHGWPASLCGKMAVGDTILAVDSTDVATAIAPFEQIPDKLSAVRELIVGEQDTLVSFKLRLINGKTRLVKMVRFSAAASSHGSPSSSKHASIGVVVDSACTVTSVAKGGAARLCGGIHVGDIITSVDGIDFSHGSQAGALMQALKGPEGSRVTIGIKTMSREGAKEATVEVVRMSELTDHLIIRATLHKQRVAAAASAAAAAAASADKSSTHPTASSPLRPPLAEKKNNDNNNASNVISPGKQGVASLHKQWRPPSPRAQAGRDENSAGRPPAHPSSILTNPAGGRNPNESTSSPSDGGKGLQTALYSYRPARGDELALKRGDAIHVLGPAPDPGWLIAQKDGKTGLIPANYVGKSKHRSPRSGGRSQKKSEKGSGIKPVVLDLNSDKDFGVEPVVLDLGATAANNKKNDLGLVTTTDKTGLEGVRYQGVESGRRAGLDEALAEPENVQGFTVEKAGSGEEERQSKLEATNSRGRAEARESQVAKSMIKVQEGEEEEEKKLVFGFVQNQRHDLPRGGASHAAVQNTEERKPPIEQEEKVRAEGDGAGMRSAEELKNAGWGREMTLEDEMSMLGRRQNEEKSAIEEEEDAPLAPGQPILPVLSPATSQGATSLGDRSRDLVSISPGTNSYASSGASPPYVGVWSDWGDPTATPTALKKSPQAPQAIGVSITKSPPPELSFKAQVAAPHASLFPPFQTGGGVIERGGVGGGGGNGDGPQLGDVFDGLPPSPPPTSSSNPAVITSTQSPPLIGVPNAELKHAALAELRRVPTTGGGDIALNGVRGDDTPLIDHHEAQLSAMDPPNSRPSIMLPSPPPSSASQPRVALPAPSPSPSLYYPQKHVSSPPTVKYPSNASATLHRISSLPSSSSSSSAANDAPDSSAFTGNSNSNSSPIQAGQHMLSARTAALRLGATKAQIQACESECELQALVDILSGSFDTNTSPSLPLFSVQHPPAASRGRSTKEPSGFTEECHVAIVRARNLPAVQGGFFCIISCTGGRGGGRTGVFQGGDSGFFTQEATVRGGGDVVVWLYRNDGDATGIVGEVRMSAESLSRAKWGEAEGWYDVLQSGQVVRTSTGVVALYMHFALMPLSSKSSTSPSAVPQAHWGGALSVPTPPQAANRHHRSSSSASSTRIDPTLENGITAQADGRNGGNVEQHGTSSSSASSTMVLASAPKTTSELAGAVQHGNTAEQMRMCEESEGREKLLRIEVMTLREQLSQAIAARESCLSEYKAVEERCRMLERTLANAAYANRERGGASGGGAARAAQLDGEVITKELGSIRADGSQRYALQMGRGGGEAQEQWFHKWGSLLDDAMRKVTGTGPVASTLQRLRSELSVAQQLLPDRTAPASLAGRRGEGADNSTRMF